MAVIDGFQSDLLITRKIDGNLENISASVLISEIAYQMVVRGQLFLINICK